MKKIEWNKKNIISATVIGLALLGLGIGTAAYGYYRMGPNSVAHAGQTEETTATTEATAVTTAQAQATTTVTTVAPEQQAQGNNNAVANNKTTQVKKTQAQQKNNNSGGYTPAPSSPSPTKAATPTTRPTTAKTTTAKPTTADVNPYLRPRYYICKGCGYRVNVAQGCEPMEEHCKQRRLEGYPCGGYRTGY